jgi:hypothetical protein
METINNRQKKDIRLLAKFVEVYCDAKHDDDRHELFALPSGLGSRTLCSGCAEFLEYAITKRLKCPLEADKPTCKNCQIHCYDASHRVKVRTIMAYAGRKLVLQGRLDYLWHYFF